MKQPLGYVSSNYPNHVRKLTKSIYGLKQAPRGWFDSLSQYLVSKGFVSCTYDPSL